MLSQKDRLEIRRTRPNPDKNALCNCMTAVTGVDPHAKSKAKKKGIKRVTNVPPPQATAPVPEGVVYRNKK